MKIRDKHYDAFLEVMEEAMNVQVDGRLLVTEGMKKGCLLEAESFRGDIVWREPVQKVDKVETAVEWSSNMEITHVTHDLAVESSGGLSVPNVIKRKVSSNQRCVQS
jgi:hypothetical protein